MDVYTVTFYDTAKGKLHIVDQNGTHITSTPMLPHILSVVESNVPALENDYFTLAYDTFFPGKLLQYVKTVSSVADLINGWNLLATTTQHELIMSHVENDASHILLTNMGPRSLHLFSGTYGHVGVWQSYEQKVVNVTFLTSATQTMSHDPNLPILVMQDRPVFNMTAYIYKKKPEGEFYMLNDQVTIPAGFYANLCELVAIMNRNIKMRGERNGYIYHFIQGKNGTMGIEAAHRQPEPSFVLIEPLSTVLGMWEGEAHTLHLRTSKKYMFEYAVARIIM
jgi:hypothetical protein